MLWLHMLFVRGAVTVDHYLGSFSRTQVELSKPPAELDAEFRRHVARAIELSEARTRVAPRDAQAHYDLGAAVGLSASHIATVEGKMFAGFKAARRAYDEHEQVLQLDPARKDAGLVVGTYRYVVSTLSLPLRMMAYVAGFGGGRERGIQALTEASVAGDEARTDALFALVSDLQPRAPLRPGASGADPSQGNVPTQPARRARGGVDGPSGRSCQPTRIGCSARA